MEMTREALLRVCKENKLYQTPSLNDKLYCNFKGFTSVGCLDEYVNLKSLFLEGNAIESLQGLPPLPQLKCLYAQQNLITSLEGLDGLPALDTLNISSNQLTSLDHLQCVAPSLRTLVATDNHLEAPEALAALAACSALESLDLQNNKLGDGQALLALLRGLPQLKCLYLRGNPLVSSLGNYRKAVVSAIPTLAYLDDRPVFERERRCAEAWFRGGLDAEREERALCVLEEQQKERRNFEALQRIREEGFRKRREVLGLSPGTTDPFFDTLDDSEYRFQDEPEELRLASARLAALTGAQQHEEPLPELMDSAADIGAASSGVPSRAMAVFEQPGTEDDVRAVLEDRAVGQAELAAGLSAQPSKAEGCPAAKPEENANPNAAEVLAGKAPAAEAAVPAARVTVTVGDSLCCGTGSGPAAAGGDGTDVAKAEGAGASGSGAMAEGAEDCGQGELGDSDDDTAAQAWAENAAAGLATLVCDECASDSGSDSVASDEVINLDELD